jgi:hypothetical protein
MNLKSLCIACLALAAAWPLVAQVPSFSTPSPASADPVSMITLIANGTSYNRHRISVAGFLDLTGADWLLYAGAEQAAAKDTTSAIKVAGLPNEMMGLASSKGGWVRMVGTFRKTTPSTEEPWAGTLDGAGVQE